MTTSEIADAVNAGTLYVKRDRSPVTAFQIHGRTRKYDHLFTRTGGTVGLVRWGASPTSVSTVATTKPAAAAEPAPGPSAARTVKVDPCSLEEDLLTTDRFRSAGTIDFDVPNRPGLYAIRLREGGAFPSPFDELSRRRGHDLVYVGIASESLNKRLLGQELRGRGHGTFFRSIGAVLGYRPLAGSLVGKANTRNYVFTEEDNRSIIGWINENLLVNWIEFSGDHEALESVLITRRLPLLNLKGNPAKLPELALLRAECVRIANVDPSGAD
mgnify:FL=1